MPNEISKDKLDSPTTIREKIYHLLGYLFLGLVVLLLGPNPGEAREAQIARSKLITILHYSASAGLMLVVGAAMLAFCLGVFAIFAFVFLLAWAGLFLTIFYTQSFYPDLSRWEIFLYILISCALAFFAVMFYKRNMSGLSHRERTSRLAAKWTAFRITMRRNRIRAYVARSAEYVELLVSDPLLALSFAGVRNISDKISIGVSLAEEISGSYTRHVLKLYVSEVRGITATAEMKPTQNVIISTPISIHLPDEIMTSGLSAMADVTIETEAGNETIIEHDREDMIDLNRSLFDYYDVQHKYVWTIEPKSVFIKYHWVIAGLSTAISTSFLYTYEYNLSDAYYYGLTKINYSNTILSWWHLISGLVFIAPISLAKEYLEKSKFYYLYNLNIETFLISSGVSIASSFGFLFLISIFLR